MFILFVEERNFTQTENEKVLLTICLLKLTTISSKAVSRVSSALPSFCKTCKDIRPSVFKLQQCKVLVYLRLPVKTRCRCLTPTFAPCTVFIAHLWYMFVIFVDIHHMLYSDVRCSALTQYAVHSQCNDFGHCNLQPCVVGLTYAGSRNHPDLTYSTKLILAKSVARLSSKDEKELLSRAWWR